MLRFILFRCFFVFVIILLYSGNLFPQNIGTLRGVVRDSTNGEALAYGNVLIKELNMGASTDERGFFIITSIPANKTYNVVISYVGYRPREIPLFITRNKILDIEIDLVPISLELQAIEKVGKKFGDQNATDISIKTLNIRELELLPKGVETDILRSLQTLPGVQSGGDISAKFYVRGSPSDQNLVLFNGATVYYPYHSLGMFSVIDPDMINNVEFYKGGFTSEYSGRLSSVLKLVTKDGNKNRISAMGGASFVTAKVLVEGPIPDGSFIVTGRKSYSDEVLKKFINKNIPIDFYDLSFKVNYSNDEFMKNAKFAAHGFISGDRVENNNPLLEDFNWSNLIYGVNYFQFVENSPLFIDLNFFYSQARGEVLPNQSSARRRKNIIRDATVTADIHYVYDSKDELVVGMKIQEVTTDLQITKSINDLVDLSQTGTNFSAYLRYRLMRFSNFGLDFGLRVNLTRLAAGGYDEKFYEPRINATYVLSENISLKGAWGLYNQDLVTVTDENEVISLFDPWTITPLYLAPAYAQHLVAGITYTPSEHFKFDVEGYYKKIYDLPANNEQRYFPHENLLVSGEGKSYGLETSAEYKDNRFSLSVAYSLGWAKKTVLGKEFYPRYDSRHKISIVSQYELSEGWIVSAIWIYNSGFPYTQSAGYYDKLRIDDLFDSGSLYDSFFPASLLGERNSIRMPDYHRLDLSLSKKFRLGNMSITMDVSVINVYDRSNVFYFKRENGERVNQLPFLPTATVKVEL